MKREIAEKWAADLRSGSTVQGTGALHERFLPEPGFDEQERFCCLGRLCVLALEAGVDVKVGALDAPDEGAVLYDRHDAFLPEAVREWAGMRSEKGTFKAPYIGKTGYAHNSLAAMNDTGCSFAEIAEAIEKRRDEL